jgi:menaquinone-dependent protoporphyrinogen oxidase
MTVLVAYGTVGGSTAEIAEWVGEELRAAGLTADVRPAGEVTDVSGYEAVVLGAAVYAAGWHNDARRFAHRFAASLADRPVWLFSSGPLDTSAETTDLAPIPQAESAIRALRARGHMTFGGRLSADAHGWLGVVAKRMTSEGHGGDFRNPPRVRRWARGVAAEIGTQAREPRATG